MQSALFLPFLLVPALPGLEGVLPAAAPEPARPAQPPEAALAWGDVDGDGLADVVVVDASARVRLLIHMGAGRFEEGTAACGLGEQPGATCALLADLDGDGHQDLFLGSSETRVWRNLGNGSFVPLASGVDHDLVDLGVQAVDRDEDGRPDLEIRTEAGDLVYRNLGGGRFERLDLPRTLGGASLSWVPLSDAPGAQSTEAAADDRTVPAAALAAHRFERWSRERAQSLVSRSSGSSTASLGAPGALCLPGIDDQAGGSCIGASSVPDLGKLYPISTDLFVDAATGRVGLGTLTPTKRLEVNGEIRMGNGTSAEQDIEISSANGNWQVGSNNSGNGTAGNQFYVYDSNAASYAIAAQAGTGNVGFGTRTPLTALHVRKAGDARIFLEADTGNDNEDAHPQVAFSQDGGFTSAFVGFSSAFGVSDNAFRLWTQESSTPIVLGTNNVERLSIDAAGLVSVKQSLEIRGGADIVEHFESSCGELEPGTVVVIDPEHPGALACSIDAYDTKVAGVVSGAGGVKPGLCLGQDGVLEGETPVAMTGRVYVKCSTENGPIRPGDRLTTASIAGHAMRVSDEQRSVGAVIGKAMSALDEGTGLVLVLVNLQ